MMRKGKASFFFFPLTVIAAAASMEVSLGGDPEMNLQIGPIPGFTTAWHGAPEQITVPLGEKVRFRTKAVVIASVRWIGAEYLGKQRDPATGTEWSVAECALTAPGKMEVRRQYDYYWGESSQQAIVLNVVPKPMPGWEQPKVKVSSAVVKLPNPLTNESTFRIFNWPSIAKLRTLRDRTNRGWSVPRRNQETYITSVDKKISLEAVGAVGDLGVLFEWRIGAQTKLSRTLELTFTEPGSYLVSVGPPQSAADIRFEIYRARITSHVSDSSRIPDGEAVTFVTATEPPGYEDYVTWLASTKYGTGVPVMGEGREFTVKFDQSFGLQSGPDRQTLGEHFQWLGVRADNDFFNQDQKIREAIKIVPLRFCIIDTGDMSPQNGRLNVGALINIIRQKNVIWAQCGLQFRLNRNAVDFVADPLDPPLGAGMTGDIEDPDTPVGLLEYLVALLLCNREAGDDAFEKMNEIFIRAFVDPTGAPTNTLGATVTPEPCRLPILGWKPVVIDPNWFAAPLPDLGRVLAHENGHALSLQHTANMGDLMFPTFGGGGFLISRPECLQARREAQKLSGTVDKDRSGRPGERDQPRTRNTPDEKEIPLQPGAGIFEYAVTATNGIGELGFTNLLAGVPPASDEIFTYRFMLDADQNPDTGGDLGPSFGLEGEFTGAEFYVEFRVRFTPDPEIVQQAAFVFERGQFVEVDGVSTDVVVMPITSNLGEMPALVAAHAKLPYSALPVELASEFRTVATAESAAFFDQSPELIGTRIPFEEPTLILVSPLQGGPGTVLDVQGQGFAPNTRVEISVNLTVAAEAFTDDSGSFSAAVVVPDLPSGFASVLAIDEEFASDSMLFQVLGQ